MFEYINENGYFLLSCTALPRCNIVNRITKTVLDEIVYKLPEQEQNKLLDEKTISIDAGLQGLSRKMWDNYVIPMYELSKNLNLFKDDGTAKFGYGEARHDQTLFCIYAYKLNLTIQPEGWFELTTSSGTKKMHIHWEGRENYKRINYLPLA